MKKGLGICLVGFCVVLVGTSLAWAEAKELRVAKQYGIGYLQLMLMEERKLVETHAFSRQLSEDAGVLEFVDPIGDCRLGSSCGGDPNGHGDDGMRRQDLDQAPRRSVRPRV